MTVSMPSLPELPKYALVNPWPARRVSSVASSTGQLSYVALEHGRTAAIQLVMQRSNHRWMVVTKVVHAIAG